MQYVTEQLIRRYGVNQALEGGLKVYTSLDLRLQNDAIKALKSTLPAGPAGALVSIDPATGYIRAMVASTDYRTTKFNLAWQSHRQLGSAMKPFALTAAVEQGAEPGDDLLRLDAAAPLPRPDGGAAVLEREHLLQHLRRARSTWCRPPGSPTTRSTPSSLWTSGPRKIVTVAHRMGITSRLQPYPSIVLGSEVVNPLEVADAYATFAAEGVRHAPQAIEKVVFPNGRVDRLATPGHRAIPAGVAYVVDKILEGNTRFGTAAAMPSYYQGVAAGKTGTTTNSADAWFCGFDPKLATAVWMGYPQAEVPMPGVQGATYCVPIWGKYYQMVFGSQADRRLRAAGAPAGLPAVDRARTRRPARRRRRLARAPSPPRADSAHADGRTRRRARPRRRRPRRPDGARRSARPPRSGGLLGASRHFV